MLSPQSISYRYLLKKSWPIMLANASVPLLGLVDTAVIGNLGETTDLGAIALGALIFTFVYWSFGFLRMGATGFTAQANGAGDEAEVRAVLGRFVIMAVILGLMIIALQLPIRSLAFSLLEGGETVESLAMEYFDIRIWGAPATLLTFSLMGLLVGLGNSKQLLIVQLFLNGLNISLDIYFAGILNLGVAGIALGTVIAEWITVCFAFLLIVMELKKRKTPEEAFWSRSGILDRQKLLRTVSANADIMIRTLLLVFSFAFFTNQSARFGDVVLAANHILLQFVTFAAFFLDAYAFVVEALVGSAIGAKRQDLFDVAVKKSTILAAITALFLAAAVWILGGMLINLLTDLEDVRGRASGMLYLAAIYIFFSFAAFQLDGIFIGASSTKQMRNAAVLSLSVYLIAWWLLIDRFGVTGLWWAMIIYVAARADALLIYYPKLRASVGIES